MAATAAAPERAVAVHRRPQLTGKTLFVLGSMNMIDCINVNLLLPYVDRMVSDFLQTTPADPKVAQYVGLLVGLYSLCEVIFSVLWGNLADRIGRKPALLIGLAGSVVAPIMFGLGSSMLVVFIARGLDGFFCGNVGVTRTYLGEIVDERTEARGFSFLSVCFSLGLFIGPMLGGELVYPATFAPQIFGGTIFDKHPYLLPNLAYAIFAAIAWIIGALFLEETLPPSERRGCFGSSPAPQAVEPLMRRRSSSVLGVDPRGAPSSFVMDLNDDGTIRPRSSNCYPQTLLQVMLAYCVLAGCTTANTQLFVLIVSYPRSEDGFALGPQQIGILQNVAAVGVLVTQLVLYKPLTQRMGLWRTFALGWSLYVVAFGFLPFFGLFADPEVYGIWRYAGLAVMQLVAAMASGLCYPTAFTFINRASQGMDKGAVNGWASSSGALCRAVFPPAAGWLLSVGAQSSLPDGKYMAVHINLFVGSVAMLCALPGLRKADSITIRRVPSPSATFGQMDVTCEASRREAPALH